jgi:beta-glucanase (GH16 family)
MKNLTIFIVLAFFTLSCQMKNREQANSTVQEDDAETWQLVWSDEFDTDGLPDSTRWNYDTRGNEYGWGNNEKQWYTVANPENSRIENGILFITAKKEPTSGKDYSSARLTTKGKGDWLYCKVEVRAKLPTGNGTWPAIWMLPTENTYGGWPKSGEIDIMEHVGFNPDTVFSTVHTGSFNHMIGTQVGKKIGLPTATTEFHVYTTEWDENEIRSYVDGEHYFTFKNNGEGFEAWPFDQPFHLILNLAIGGGLGGQKGIDDSLFPHTFEVDYVRVYKQNPANVHPDKK